MEPSRLNICSSSTNTPKKNEKKWPKRDETTASLSSHVAGGTLAYIIYLFMPKNSTWAEETSPKSTDFKKQKRLWTAVCSGERLFYRNVCLRLLVLRDYRHSTWCRVKRHSVLFMAKSLTLLDTLGIHWVYCLFLFSFQWNFLFIYFFLRRCVFIGCTCKDRLLLNTEFWFQAKFLELHQ